MLARVILAAACVLATTARYQQNVSTTEVVKISVDCSRQEGHVDITMPACLPPTAVQCPVCSCPAQQCLVVNCAAPQCPLPPTKVATPTGSGYELFPGLGHYKFHAYGATWQQARQRCSDEGAHLVIINSQREANVIITLFVRYPTMPGAEQTGWAWTGVQEHGGNGIYVTLFGESLSTTGFNIWSPSEPNDPGPDDCVLTHRINAYLADAACERKFAFICELELK